MSTIENLLVLYQVDKQVRGLKSRVDNAHIYLTAQQKMLDELNASKDSMALQSKKVQATVANLETESSSIDERVDKLREDLKQSATTKQYNAILEEINTLKNSRGELDDRTLAELEGIDKIKSDMEELDKKIEERTKVCDTAEQELKERTEEVSDQLNKLQTERDSKASLVEASALNIFNQTADDFDGDAMAPIEAIDSRRMEYACGCCNVSLPFNLVNTIVGDRNKVAICEGCLRILYATEDMRSELVKK